MTTEQERKVREALADLATNVEAAWTRASPREGREQRQSAISLAFWQIAMIMEPRLWADLQKETEERREQAQ